MTSCLENMSNMASVQYPTVHNILEHTASGDTTSLNAGIDLLIVLFPLLELVCVYMKGLSSTTNPKPRGKPSQCLYRHT